MASFSNSCGVCDLRHTNKPSIVWCTECDEGLCKECQEHHSLSKGTKNHKTIAITEYMNLPNDVLRITQNCVKHQEKFIIYCRMHEGPCCGKCVIESHKDCRDIENLDDVIRNVKTSNAVYEIEETLVEVAENLQKIRQHQQKVLSTLKEKREEIEKDIRKTRATINNHLDKLQEDFLKQLYAVEEKENLNIRQLLSALEEKEKELSDKKRNIANIKQYATELQLFLSIKQIEEDISSKDNILNSLLQEDNLKNNSLKYKLNTAIQNILTDIKSFGDIQIEAKPCEIVLTRKKTRQAQIIVPEVQTRSIENIKLKLNNTILNDQGIHIFGCCTLPDGRMVFTYYFESAVKVFSDTGLKVFEVKTPCYAFDVVYISENNALAVTSGGSHTKCITIIDLEKKKIKKTITLDSYNYGITLKGSRLICSGNKGITVINLFDESTSIMVRDKIPNDCYIAAFGNLIYHTNWDKHVITCYDQQGKLQWTFHNESVLKYPHGIDVDDEGNVYVAGSSSNNVVVISPDGQRHREVLTKSDGLARPFSLSYDNSKKQLLVATTESDAFLFVFI